MRHLCPALTLIALSLASPPTDAREPRRIVPSQQVEAQPDFVEQAHIHRLRAIKQLRGLPNPGLDPDVKSEMMHRLAELYIEEARYWYFNEMEGESEDHTESRKWTQAAVRLYERIGSEHPTFSRGDEAAWYLSIAYDELDRPQDALQARIDLVRDFPGSDFAASAYVQIGEHHFDRNDAYKALLAYKHATEIPGHDKVDYARYKLGWCYYNVGEYDQAIVMMRAVASRPPATETGAIQLAEEAQRDLVRFYIDTERIDEAIATIDSLPLQPTETARLMARMAEQLTESGLFTDSARVWKILLSRDPLAAEAPRYLDEVVALHQQVGDQAALRESLARSASLFNRDSTWHRTHADSPDILQHTLDLRESRTRKLALTLHEQARKTQDREQLAQAGDLYAAWLSEFDGLVEEPDVRFAYGELLYSQGRYSESFAEYTAVVDLDPKGRHARFCAEAAIHAAQKVIAAQPDADGPLTSAERNLLAAADRFLAMFPNDKLAQNVTYQTAYLLYGRDQLDEATARFRQVITMDPTTADAIRGADLLEDSLALAGQWDLLQETALEFYNLEGLGDSAFKADTWKVYERASFKRIEAKLTEDGDGVAAAEAWVAFADEFPTAEIADLALNNAAVNFHTAGLIRSAMDAQEALITRHPTSSYVPDQMAALG
ncbi:MAG: TolA-binding protein, partial [Myxococcota bacterium]